MAHPVTTAPERQNANTRHRKEDIAGHQNCKSRTGTTIDTSRAMASRLPVLLVDPFADERDMYATYLRARGIEVVVCRDAVAALAFARQHSVKVVVARLLQAGSFDGVALTRALKEDERTRCVPVIIITTQSHRGMRATAEQAGCDRVLLLPCLPDQLAAEIRRITRSGTA